MLALAADLRPLRRNGIGITIGDLLLAPPDSPGADAAAARRPATARLLRVEPALTAPSGDETDTFAAPFGR